MSDAICKELTLPVVLSTPVGESFRALEIVESGRYPFDRLHTRSLLLERQVDRVLAGLNPIHLALVPGAPRVALRPRTREGIRHFVRPLAESHFDNHLTQRLFGQILWRVERRAGIRPEPGSRRRSERPNSAARGRTGARGG